MFDELDIVVAKRQLSPTILAGTQGTIMMVLGNHQAYLVDFTDIDSEHSYTDADIAVSPDDMELIWKWTNKD